MRLFTARELRDEKEKILKTLPRKWLRKESVVILLFLASIFYIARQSYTRESSREARTLSTRNRYTTPVLLPRSTQRIHKDHFVICKATGRLGNLMFTYASIYGIAQRKNMSVAIDATNPLLDYFNLDAKVVNIDSLHGYNYLMEARPCDFDEKLTMFDNDKDILIEKYLQSWKYFFHVEDLVREQFQFPPNVTAKVDKLISNLRKEKMIKVRNASVTVIGIHYRRGDMIERHYAEYGYVTAPIDYVKKAMTYFRLFHDNVLFLVATDSQDYVKENLAGEDIVFLTGNSAIEDMAFMAHCDHIITTVGSFGWWSAFLNRGQVVYYKYSAVEGSGLRKDFGKSYENYHHPTWIGMA